MPPAVPRPLLRPLGRLRVIRFNPAHAAFHPGLVAALQPQAHGQIGMAATAPTDAVQAPLQVGEQPLRSAGASLAACCWSRRRLERSDSSAELMRWSIEFFALTQPLVLPRAGTCCPRARSEARCATASPGQRASPRCRAGIALDAQRLHFLRRELGRRHPRRAAPTCFHPRTAGCRRTAPAGRRGSSATSGVRYCAWRASLVVRGFGFRAAADARLGRSGGSPAAATARGRARASPGTGRSCPRACRAAPSASCWKVAVRKSPLQHARVERDPAARWCWSGARL